MFFSSNSGFVKAKFTQTRIFSCLSGISASVKASMDFALPCLTTETSASATLEQKSIPALSDM